MSTPIELYKELLQTSSFKADSEQEYAIKILQKVYEDFIAHEKEQDKTFSRWLNKTGWLTKEPVKGAYLWGPVGVGKTRLMDIFYDCLPAHKKLRMHFHRFMHHIHQELRIFQGHTDPLKKIAKNFAKKINIICLDEFLVTDIADAMVLANLLTALFAEGISLVTTANTAPDDLYRYGLQRPRFLPAIDLLKRYLTVVQLNPQIDYRLRPQKPAGNYFFPLDGTTEQALQASFNYYAPSGASHGESLSILGRLIPTIASSHDVVWFDFAVICHAPRSQLDYLAIANHFPTVIISNVPQINPEDWNTASYFIKLVDIFYDAKIKLILSAAVAVYELYPCGNLRAEFARTQSRLIEMQGEEYGK